MLTFVTFEILLKGKSKIWLASEVAGFIGRNLREALLKISLLAGTTQDPEAVNEAYSFAVSDRTTLDELYAQLHRNLLAQPVCRDFCSRDVCRNSTDISKAQRMLFMCPPSASVKDWRWS